MARKPETADLPRELAGAVHAAVAAFNQASKNAIAHGLQITTYTSHKAVNDHAPQLRVLVQHIDGPL